MMKQSRYKVLMQWIRSREGHFNQKQMCLVAIRGNIFEDRTGFYPLTLDLIAESLAHSYAFSDSCNPIM
jgi:hypothetical protein